MKKFVLILIFACVSTDYSFDIIKPARIFAQEIITSQSYTDIDIANIKTAEQKEKFFLKILDLIENNHNAIALSHLDNYIETYQDDSRAYEIRSKLRLDCGDINGSIRDGQSKMYCDNQCIIMTNNGKTSFHYLKTNIITSYNNDLEKAAECMEHNDYRGAYTFFKKYLALNNDDCDATKKIAFICRRIGKYDESAMYYNNLIRRENDVLLSNYKLAGVYYEHGKYNQAIEILSELISEHDNDVNQILKNCTNDIPIYSSIFNLRGICYLDTGNKDKSMEDFNNAVILNPKNMIVRFNRGQASWIIFDNEDDALYDFNKNIDTAPVSKSDHIGLAHTYRSSLIKQYQNAISEYTYVLKEDPVYPEMLYGRAYAHFKSNNYDEALYDINLCMGYNSNYAFAYCLKAKILAAQYADKQEVLDCFREAVRLNPNYADFYYQMGTYLQSSNDEIYAQRCFSLAAKKNPLYKE